MRINHKPGETMQVDWAGGTIPYYDSVTGEEFKAYLFVAVLPCSGIIYVEEQQRYEAGKLYMPHRVGSPSNLRISLDLHAFM